MAPRLFSIPEDECAAFARDQEGRPTYRTMFQVLVEIPTGPKSDAVFLSDTMDRQEAFARLRQFLSHPNAYTTVLMTAMDELERAMGRWADAGFPPSIDEAVGSP